MALASRAVCLLLVSLALCQSAVRGETETKQILGAFQQITQKSENLRTLTASINVVNVLFKGPQVGQGLADIANNVNTDASMLAGENRNSPLADTDAQAVVGALTTFVKVHQALLATVIGKHGILSLFFFAEPVRVALVHLESAVGTFALDLIDRIPTQEAAARKQFGSLSVTIDKAIEVYS